MNGPRGSSGTWRERQERDPWVRRARQGGWRSRAVFKLEELLRRESLLKPGIVCVDLGAAPGGWSQYVAAQTGGRARILALDLLPMDALPGVEIIQGDFTEAAVLEDLEARLGDARADLVMSDMAPNISGNKVIDQPRAMYLAELALALARDSLAPGGSFVCKLFQGEGSDAFIKDARSSFGSLKVRKPAASRTASREVYLVARNYQL
ncbi:MAG: SAM-dependent methyltransferase [Woeseiaceae bacterium]|nr:SAM-dependent methyltransferase [Woeseiaceae bacterium]